MSLATSSAGLKYMVPHPNLQSNWVVLPASEIVKDLIHVPRKIHVANISKKQETLLKGILIGVGTDLPEVIVHLNQAAIILPEDRKEEDKSVAVTVAAVQHKEYEYREGQMNKQIQI